MSEDSLPEFLIEIKNTDAEKIHLDEADRLLRSYDQELEQSEADRLVLLYDLGIMVATAENILMPQPLGFRYTAQLGIDQNRMIALLAERAHETINNQLYLGRRRHIDDVVNGFINHEGEVEMVDG